MAGNNKSNSGVDRRGVLTAGSAGLLVAATGADALAAPAASWDREVDVVCVGAGSAGLSAAVTAVGNGDKVILVEKLPLAGGTTLKSGGACWLPGNSAMSAAGAPDDEEACMRYMCRYAYPRQYSPDLPDYGVAPERIALLRAFYRNAGEAERRLRSLGALDLVTFQIPGSTIVAPDYAPGLPENGGIRGRTLWPKPLPDGTFGGASMVAQMTGWLERKGVEILTEHQAVDLIMEKGRAVGLETMSDGKTFRIRARKGIIFTTGGFAHSEKLVRDHQPPILGSCAAPSMTGDFIPIASRAGAGLGDLSTGWRMQVVVEEAAQNPVLAQGVFIPPGDAMLLVNRQGKRAVNEKRNYNDRTKAHFTYDPVKTEFPNDILIMIFDQRGIDVHGGAYPIPEDPRNAPHVIAGQTWRDLSDGIAKRMKGVERLIGSARLSDDFATALAETVARFNQFAVRGHDDDFHRGHDPREAEWQTFFSPRRAGAKPDDKRYPNPTLHPLAKAGPYYAIILGPGVLDTCAGPLVDDQARVLDTKGKAIPGLFGAGNCTASPTGGQYFGGGGTIGPALTFGYIAANSAHG